MHTNIKNIKIKLLITFCFCNVILLGQIRMSLLTNLSIVLFNVLAESYWVKKVEIFLKLRTKPVLWPQRHPVSGGLAGTSRKIASLRREAEWLTVRFSVLAPCKDVYHHNQYHYTTTTNTHKRCVSINHPQKKNCVYRSDKTMKVKLFPVAITSCYFVTKIM